MMMFGQKTAFSVVMRAVVVIGVFGSPLVEAGTRCGYYAGYGYRCFGDQGGTGGKVFKEMDDNTKKCGYSDPGCQRRQAKQKPTPESEQGHDANQATPPSNAGWQAPKSDGDYKPPVVGPGYQRSGS